MKIFYTNRQNKAEDKKDFEDWRKKIKSSGKIKYIEIETENDLNRYEKWMDKKRKHNNLIKKVSATVAILFISLYMATCDPGNAKPISFDSYDFYFKTSQNEKRNNLDTVYFVNDF